MARMFGLIAGVTGDAVLLEFLVVAVDPLVERLRDRCRRNSVRRWHFWAAICTDAGRVQATQTGGCGFCSGLGMTLRAGISMCSPLNP